MRKRGFEVISTFKNKSIKLPVRATRHSAGYDLSSIEHVEIKPKEMVLIKTGLKAYMQGDEVLKLYVRSSLATKQGLMLMNQVGIIDADYYNNQTNEGHILIALYNTTDAVRTIEQGERIAQAVFVHYLKTDDDVVNQERIGGFGSSNV